MTAEVALWVVHGGANDEEDGNKEEEECISHRQTSQLALQTQSMVCYGVLRARDHPILLRDLSPIRVQHGTGELNHSPDSRDHCIAQYLVWILGPRCLREILSRLEGFTN